MKFVYKGSLTSKNELPESRLPVNAVKFKEPETRGELTGTLTVGVIAEVVVMFVIVNLISNYRGVDIWGDGGLFEPMDIIALGIFLLTIFPHEILHGLCFGKDAVNEIYMDLKHGICTACCSKPITKARFIWMSACPNIILGLIPFLAWALFLYDSGFGNVLAVYSMISIIAGIGDYMNIKNAVTQMPKGSMQQLSGMNSYWFSQDKQDKPQ